jgi:uncharacterized Fe-S cluster-containing radical SAM superfamily protein
MSQYTGVDLAPYWRFRPTPFYNTVFVNGTYTADIMGCNWTCEHCWSSYGWHGAPREAWPKGSGEFTAEQVAEKLVAGMFRNKQPMCRISGGEASMYWEPHMVSVIREVLARTEGQRMKVRGKTTPHTGDAMGICIETNGSVLKPSQLSALEDELGEEAKRVVLAIGMKATNAELLAQLTGMTPATSRRFHEGQMRTLRFLALKAKHLGFFANYIDAFVDDEELARLVREVERKRPGSARLFGVDPYRRAIYDTNRFFTPKRMRDGEDADAA